VDRIVEAMARRYGKDPRVWGWQVDNEPPGAPDYGPSARAAFRTWLARRYGTVARLNEAWGDAFWSLRYPSFAQVDPLDPEPGEDRPSPHALLDFQRFTADVQADFLDRQARIIKRHASPSQWVTSNYTNVTFGSDPRRTRDLDFPTFTFYPVAGANPLGGETFRLGNPWRLEEACDYFRPIAGRMGVMELQPGQVNWAPTNPKPAPGAVRMWIWHAFAGGSSFVCTYRFRQPRCGSEMYHEGIVGLDGVTPSQGGREFVQAMAELRALEPELRPGAPLPAREASLRAALLWSHDAMWDLDNQKQGEAWSTLRHRSRYSAALKALGAPVDWIRETDDFSKHPFLVAPAYALAEPALVAKWKAYAEAGGHLVLTCRTAQKDARGHFPEAPLGGRIAGLIGATLLGYDTLPGDAEGSVQAADGDHPWRAWGELLDPGPGTEVLASYKTGFYRGRAAAVTRRLGKGSVTYIGVETLDGALERSLLREVYRRAGCVPSGLPPGVYVEFRDGVKVAVNYGPRPADLPVAPGARILLGALPLDPGQVCVWKEPELP
jgi:beta-galactosidase